jgi:hypothetical protein
MSDDQATSASFDMPVSNGNCECGLPTVVRQVQKESANKGRYFYTCPKNKEQQPCGFFQWADGQTSKVT